MKYVATKTNKIFIYFYILDNIYCLDWNVININKFVETDEKPTMEQRNSKFYEEYLSSIHVISPWYKKVSPVQVIIFFSIYFRHILNNYFIGSVNTAN